jgi:hypothetical protein
MKSLLLPALAAALLTRAALADIVIVQKIEQSGPQTIASDMTVKIKGDKVRSDVGSEMSTIIDSKGGGLITLMHSQKAAMAMPAAALDAIRAQVKSTGPDAVVADIKPTGKTGDINGFKCEEYRGKYQGMDITYWITREMADKRQILDQLSKLSGEADPFRGALKNTGGFPIRTEIAGPQGGKTTVTVVSVEEKSIPDSDFEIPSDYKKMEMPKILPTY